MTKAILPGSTIGIIGGGQLGRMMAIAAKTMGYKIAVLEPVNDGPCAKVADIEINAAYHDKEALKKLMELSDVVTYEFENIPGKIIEEICEYGYLPQGAMPLIISQDRALEKKTIQNCGLKTVPFKIINDLTDLKSGIKELGLPAVLKTCHGGYDGKGQIIITSDADIEKGLSLIETGTCVLEKYIDFICEISVIVAKSTIGEISVFPIAENIHQHNILHQTIVPARIDEKTKERAGKIGMELMNNLGFVGTLAIECFVLSDGDILINEIAPRPHNSGHYTIDACMTSQFEQHIRAICGLKLGSTTLLTSSVMVNILGQDMRKIPNLIHDKLFKQAKLHLYEKSIVKENRKMGHITFLGDDLAEIILSVNKYLNESR